MLRPMAMSKGPSATVPKGGERLVVMPSNSRLGVLHPDLKFVFRQRGEPLPLRRLGLGDAHIHECRRFGFFRRCRPNTAGQNRSVASRPFCF